MCYKPAVLVVTNVLATASPPKMLYARMFFNIGEHRKPEMVQLKKTGP